MARFDEAKTDDLLALLRLAVRRRTSPFQVTDALRVLLARAVTPPVLGEAVHTFDAMLAAECRDAIEAMSSPIARFLQASVPADTDGARVELAWQSSAAALRKLVRLERAPSKNQLGVLSKLAVDDVLLEAAQVALATSPPDAVEQNRWFFPLLVLDGGPASVDALLPHLDVALADEGPARRALRPLRTLAPADSPMATALLRLR